ncbi:hypothetical protein RvY_12575 [Ramazzottius varieornatus]|uniref:Uncharacterized protein n=1 Tax=Ramazzottius varieornatus TaxID=947166 RepID=A0A1D1VJY6_RAMVA|nr:hypothetical protein RvY_12575 [Ramazzottius varieornatus]
MKDIFDRPFSNPVQFELTGNVDASSLHVSICTSLSFNGRLMGNSRLESRICQYNFEPSCWSSLKGYKITQVFYDRLTGERFQRSFQTEYIVDGILSHLCAAPDKTGLTTRSEDKSISGTS